MVFKNNKGPSKDHTQKDTQSGRREESWREMQLGHRLVGRTSEGLSG